MRLLIPCNPCHAADSFWKSQRSWGTWIDPLERRHSLTPVLIGGLMQTWRIPAQTAVQKTELMVSIMHIAQGTGGRGLLAVFFVYTDGAGLDTAHAAMLGNVTPRLMTGHSVAAADKASSLNLLQVPEDASLRKAHSKFAGSSSRISHPEVPPSEHGAMPPTHGNLSDAHGCFLPEAHGGQPPQVRAVAHHALNVAA